MVKPAPGILLIADPFLKDPNFLRTVVLLCEHKEEDSFGFIINRPYQHTLAELVPALSNFNLPVFYGGPVQLDSLHFIHQYPSKISGGMEILPDVYWGGDFEQLVFSLKEGLVDERKIRFFVGYSGWGAGQLNSEMEEKTWLTVAANRKIIFHDNNAAVWKDSLKLLGGEYQQLINYPIDPLLN